MSTLDLDAVHVAHARGADIVRGASLQVPEGAIGAILGPSGAGKSTLLLALAGILRVREGAIRIGGREVASRATHVPPERRGVGWVPQDASLFPHLSVGENVAFGLRRERERASALLRAVGLDGFADRRPHTLSGGQASRVALARALAPQPAVIALDEPFAALDARLRTDLRRAVAKAIREQGATAVLVTHDRHEALGIADVVGVMHDGMIVQSGPPSQLYERPVNAWVARFVGDAALIPATRGDGCWHTPLGDVPAQNGPAEALLVVRPEHVKPYAAGTPLLVEDVEYEGGTSLVRGRVAGVDDEVRMRVATTLRIERGAAVPVRIHGIPHAVATQ